MVVDDLSDGLMGHVAAMRDLKASRVIQLTMAIESTPTGKDADLLSEAAAECEISIVRSAIIRGWGVDDAVDIIDIDATSLLLDESESLDK